MKDPTMSKIDNKKRMEILQKLLETIRGRFESISTLQNHQNTFFIAELIAFHGRKISETIGYLCLLAYHNKFYEVPKKHQSNYNPSKIIRDLSKKTKISNPLPKPTFIRKASAEERSNYNVKFTLESKPNLSLTIDEIGKIYSNLNEWQHEINPFKKKMKSPEELFNNKIDTLANDVERLKNFLSSFTLTIMGEGFYCTLWDTKDNKTKCISISKISNI